MNHIAQDEGGKKKEGIEPWARKKKIHADVLS